VLAQGADLDVFRQEQAGARASRYLAHRVDDVAPAAVAERQREGQRMLGDAIGQPVGLLDEVLHGAPRGRGELVEIADDPDVDVLLDELSQLFFREADHEPHERFDLELGPRPIGEAESIEGEIANAAIAAGTNHFANCARPFVMPGGPVESAALGPTAVAVHDHRYVTRQLSAA
jgi:hypothetical protein